MSDKKEGNVIEVAFTREKEEETPSELHPLVQLVKEGVDYSLAHGDVTQIVYVILDNNGEGAVGYASNPEGGITPRALLALAAALINAEVNPAS